MSKLSTFHNGPALYADLIAMNDLALEMREFGALTSPEAREVHRGVCVNSMLDSQKMFTALVDPEYQLGKVGQHDSLKSLFFNKYGLRPIRYSDKTGAPKLDAFTLKEFSVHPLSIVKTVATQILGFRKKAKLLSTYIDGLPVDADQVVHATWKPHGTITGRWACGDPNLMNIPKIMRNMFIARPGKYLVAADYTQLELRIAAVQANCKYLLDLFASGVDIHQKIAESAFSGMVLPPKARDAAKVLEYGGVLYGGDDLTIYQQLAPKFPMLTLGMISTALRNVKSVTPEIPLWQKRNFKKAYDTGYVEEPLSGRREWFHDNVIIPTKVYNFPVQSMAGTLTNRAVLALRKYLDWKTCSLLFQVHDELTLEVDDPEYGVKILREVMEQSVQFGDAKMLFTVDVSVGKNWGKATTDNPEGLKGVS